MSVATRNPFALLDEGDDDEPQTSVAVPVPASAVETLPEEPKQQKSSPRNVNGRAKGEKTADGFEVKEGRGDRRGRGGDRGDRGDRGGRGRGRGGRGRGGGGNDRQSHTGHVDSQKQVHQGWGGDTAEVEQAAEVQGAADASKEAEAPAEPPVEASWGDAKADAGGEGWDTAAVGATTWDDTTLPAASTDAPAAAAAPAPAGEFASGPPKDRAREEEEDNTVSYDEWLKKQKEEAGGTLDSLVPKLEGRKVNEGEGYEDGVLTRTGVEVLKSPKEKEEAFFVGKSKTKSPPAQPRHKKEKITIEIEPRFAPIERGGRGRGGRGGDRGGDRPGRGGRGRGAGRGSFGGGFGGGFGDSPRGNGRPAGGAGRNDVDVDDTSAFPTLA